MLQEEISLIEERNDIREKAIADRITMLKKNLEFQNSKISKLKNLNFFFMFIISTVVLITLFWQLGFLNNSLLSSIDNVLEDSDYQIDNNWVKFRQTGDDDSYFIFGKVESYQKAVELKKKMDNFGIEAPYLIVSNTKKEVSVEKIYDVK